ncbi:MAG: hypothetical protein AB1796_08270 [Bacillota bacterium]
MREKVDTSVDFCGITLKHPLGVAPHAIFAPPGMNPRRVADLLLRYADAGAAYIYTPVIRSEEKHPFDLIPTGNFQLNGSAGSGKAIYAIADKNRIQCRRENGIKLITILKKEMPKGLPLIANITVPSSDPEQWVEHACTIAEAGADFIELNPSCPLNLPVEKETFVPEDKHVLIPYALGDSPAEFSAVIRAVCSAVTVPVGIKMAAELGFPRLVNAHSLFYHSGARFVTGINAPIAIAPPDINREGRGSYPGLDVNPFAAVIGPWIRYLCYRNTAAVAAYLPEMAIGAAGGIVEKEHVIEVIMLGAKLVELSSGIMLRGIPFLQQCIRFLKEFMLSRGYESMEDLRAMGLPYIVPSTQVDWLVGKMVAEPDQEHCNGCGLCARNLCFAISMRGKMPFVKTKDCGACGLCVAICPKMAMKLVPLSDGVQAD